jgi:hypothetical protein
MEPEIIVTDEAVVTTDTVEVVQQAATEVVDTDPNEFNGVDTTVNPDADQQAEIDSAIPEVETPEQLAEDALS